MTRIHVNKIAVGVLLVGLLAACGPTDGAAPTTSSTTVQSSTSPATSGSTSGSTTSTSNPSSTPSVSLSRTGGIAGVNQTIVIAADGTWTYTDKRTSTTQNGQLSPAMLGELARLAVDPRVAQELLRSGPAVCADAYQYTLTVNGRGGSYSDCGEDRPTVRSLLMLITENTAF